MGKEFTPEDAALLDELGVESQAEAGAEHNPAEERIIAGFMEIRDFVRKHGRSPQHGEGRDIFERMHAARLDNICKQPKCRELLESLDDQGLLTNGGQSRPDDADALDDDELLAQLGVEADESDITQLRHVRPTAERQAADVIANRTRCADFSTFKPLFARVQEDIDRGVRRVVPFEGRAGIEQGRFFIVGGQKAYVAEKGELAANNSGFQDARMRVIFDNGTESNLLMRSLQRALHKDEAGRRITDPTDGPLFADEPEDGDRASGTVYVLRSLSDDPQIADKRELLHKIGVTNMPVERRIANARKDPTFLLADVQIVAAYKLYSINRTKLENLIHHVFAPARLDIQILDRFGNPVSPREWFLVPRPAIDEAVERIKDKTITQYTYNPQSASLQKHNPKDG